MRHAIARNTRARINTSGIQASSAKAMIVQKVNTNHGGYCHTGLTTPPTISITAPSSSEDTTVNACPFTNGTNSNSTPLDAQNAALIHILANRLRARPLDDISAPHSGHTPAANPVSE